MRRFDRLKIILPICMGMQAIACTAAPKQKPLDSKSTQEVVPGDKDKGAPDPEVNAGVRQGEQEQLVCTVPLVGRHKTYDVGPGKRYAELDDVPFGSLVAGDVVNIYARPESYRSKFGLRARGTAAKPVVINGVSDPACRKPVLDFAGARTARGSNGPGSDVFGSPPQYNEGLGGIVIKRGPSTQDAYGVYEPEHIIVQGLHVQGAKRGAFYTTLEGKTEPYGSAACIWVQSGIDITIRNNVVTDCAFGIFFMAKDDLLSETTVRAVIANNRVYGHGVVGSYSEHGFYVQAASPIVDGNFIGRNREGSEGSSYKSRASGEVFRYNVVQCTALCMDMVQSEEQEQGIVRQPDYGTDYVYANTIISHGPPAIHYGGDNRGEQERGPGTATNEFVAPVPYRRHLRFWNNTYVLTSAEYRLWVFRLSEKRTEVDAWNNHFVFHFTGGGQLSWLNLAGTLRLGPGNEISGHAVVDAQTEGGATPSLFSVSSGAPIPADPELTKLK